MSVSSVGSSNAYVQWPFQTGSAGGSSDTSPTDALQSLYQALTGGNSSDPLIAALGQDGGSGDSGSSSNSAGMPQFSADTMSALLSMQSGQGGPAGDIAKDVIAKFDTNGDGQISQSEFEQAIGSGADQSGVDALFNKLDSNGDGSVSQDELQTAMQKAHGGGHGHHHHHAEASGDSSQQQGGGDPLQALLSGATADGTTSQTSSNPDGSSTTTITYADGTKLEMTTPAASSDSGNSSGSGSGNPNSFNLGSLLKMMVNLQAQLAPSTTNMSV
ncbi:EF-hand domain-containing protein [Rhodoplanes sp. Z2-YC6860]|uniref:EF-hand domain-containing protein n=1 Tax=Rhodoplanes sp. Z2-YC6860 TaxID=674703 RepID=UPI00078D4176|nr:EF-hand domain-containing protein [Rhodoplanes sp. Z2-YC6860]AMN41666.1 calcium-binding EF-hand domain-containing protein [Rhodoplanes sp. Z2-YC6860]